MHYLGLRHKSERSRAVKNQPMSHSKIFFDKLTFIVGVIGPFTILPQIFSIFTTKSAIGVSLAT